jgi:YbbR domain-containing protein
MKNKFLSPIFRNFQYKISALILACLFWYIVQGEEILEINRRIEVTIRVPEGYIVKGTEKRIKDATLRGSRVLLGDFSMDTLKATIRVPEGKVGQIRYRIDKEFIKGWDNRIKLTVHDPYITVFVDEKVSKKVPVREFLKGVPADGYIIEKSVIKPSTVTVTGLKSEVAKIEEVLTEPIDVENLSATKSFDAKLVLKDIPESGLSNEVVQVNLMVGEKKINKRFGSVPVEVVGSDFLTAVKPRFVSIVVQGTPGVLSFVKRSDLEAFVEGRELEPGKKHSRPIQVKIPPDTVLIETFPQTATVEVYNQKRLN